MQNKHDDMCPCTRFRAQDEFCTCGAVAREEIVKDTSRRFGERLHEIQRTPSPQPRTAIEPAPSLAAENERLREALRNAPDVRHFQILVEAMSEVKATNDGQSDQTITGIVDGCLAEIAALEDRT